MLTPASRFTAPVQSTSTIITNHDDSMQPDAPLEQYQEPNLYQYQNQSESHPPSHFAAPVQSTSAMVITNEDDSMMKPTVSNGYFQEPYFPEHQAVSLKPSSMSRYSNDRFVPTQAIKEKTIKNAIGLAAAVGGFMYLRNKTEKAQTPKIDLKALEKLKIAAVQSSASRKTNMLLTWILGLGGTGLTSYVGIEAIKFAKAKP